MIELKAFFAGSRSTEKSAEKKGIKTWSTDWKNFDKIDLVADILDLAKDQIPDGGGQIVLWFSPDCSTYSMAACSHHRRIVDGVPVAYSEKAKKADKVLEKVHEIISWFPDAIWFIENPRGLMRKMPSMLNLPKHTVTYCQYGDTRMKPTDIFTNCKTWQPRKMCKNGSPCHVAAPRGSKTGTQGLKGDYERSKLPEQLCDEIIESLTNINPQTKEK